MLSLMKTTHSESNTAVTNETRVASELFHEYFTEIGNIKCETYSFGEAELFAQYTDTMNDNEFDS